MTLPFELHLESVYVWRIIGTVLLVLVAVTLSRLLKRLTARVIDEPKRQYRLSKLIGRTMTLLAVVLVVALWAPKPGSVLTVLTVIGAGLAISMREATLSAAGWINLVLRQGYKVGDRVEINGIKGDVIDVRLLHTTLMEVGGWVEADQSTGRIVHVPNAWVFLHGFYNYSQGFSFVWHEMSVTIAHHSDWRKARELMLAMARESAAVVEARASDELRRVAHEYLVHYSILTPFVYVSIAGDGVRLTLRYLTEVRKRRGTEHAFSLAMLESFRQHGIELAGQKSKSEPAEPSPAEESGEEKSPPPRRPLL